jgi:hypothetical protein
MSEPLGQPMTDSLAAARTPAEVEWDRLMRFLERWGYSLRDSDGCELPDRQYDVLRWAYDQERHP